MTTENTQEFNIDSLLDGTLDDLADLPEFRPYPAGTYRLRFSVEADKKLKQIYFAKLKVLETVELTDASETPVEAGAETSVRYDLSNQFGQGNFKKLMSSVAEHYGSKSMRELLEEVRNPVEAVAVVKQNVNKKDGKIYTDIVEIQIV